MTRRWASLVTASLVAGQLFGAGIAATVSAQAAAAAADPAAASQLSASDLGPYETWAQAFGTVGDDQAKAVAVDTGGNIAVAGNVYGTASYDSTGGLPGQTGAGEDDAFVRVVGTTGAERWTRQFGTPQLDHALGVAVDFSGSVTVVGETNGTLPGEKSAGSWDAFVRSYGSGGNVRWTHQFGTATTDTLDSVAVDGAGNIFVAGSTDGSLPGQVGTGARDSFVRAYSPDGTELWTRQFGTDAWTEALGIAVDRSGNVLVAGDTEGALPGQSNAGLRDAFVRSYSPDGTERWTRQFGTGQWDEALGVAADSHGNVIVAGDTRGALPGQTMVGDGDAFVRSYTPDGIERWTHQFGTPGTSIATSLAVDAADYVVVAGSTQGVLSGQTRVGGADVFLRDYGPDGADRWTRQFGSSEDDYAQGVAVDPAGKVVVAGTTNGVLTAGQPWGGDGFPDAFVAEFGTMLSSPPTEEIPMLSSAAAEVNSDGIFVFHGAGDLYTADPVLEPGQTRYYDGRVAAYAPDGTRRWTHTYGASGLDERPDALAVDGSGNVFVAGADETAEGYMATVRAYGPDGTQLWTRQFGGALGTGVVGVGVDSAGNVYVAGNLTLASPPSSGIQSTYSNAYVRSFAPDGSDRFYQQFGGDQNFAASAFAVDGAGDVLLAGMSSEAFVLECGPSGDQRWISEFGVMEDAEVTGLILGSGGDVFAVGWSFRALPGQSSSGAFVRDYRPDGSERWTNQFGGRVDAGNVLVDPAGSIVVADWSTIRKIGRDGTQLWTLDSYAPINAMTSDKLGDVLVAGATDARPGEPAAVAGFLGAYSPDGVERWTRRGPSSGWAAIQTDSAGDIHVAGWDGVATYQAPGVRIAVEGAITSFPILEGTRATFQAAWAPATTASISGTDSDQALTDLQAGRIQVALSTRPLTQSESAGLYSWEVGADAIVLAVQNSPEMAFLNNITSAQVRGIYEGTISNWDQLGGPDRPIVARSRSIGSDNRNDFVRAFGIHEARERATIGATGLPRLYSSTEEAAAAASDPYEIVYTGLANVGVAGLKVLTLDDVAPTALAVQNGTYTAQRQLIAAIRKDGLDSRTEDSAMVRGDDFVNYLLSPAGQSAVDAAGFIQVSAPVTPPIPNWDINLDGGVGLADLGAITAKWGQATPWNGWIRADVNNDGAVGLADLGAITSRWGGAGFVPPS